MAEARVSISLIEGKFEVEGSESFVAAQVEKITELVKCNFKPTSADPIKQNLGSVVPSANTEPATNSLKLDEVFATNGESLQILKDIPGSSTAEKTVSAAKLYLYGMKALQQKDSALFEEVKAVCKAHGFYDSHHMAAYLKAEKESFLFGGSGKKQTLQLTVPGNKSAAKLVAEVQGTAAAAATA